MRVLKHGNIVKCGGNWKSWKKRYVEILDTGVLVYYTAKGGEKKGEIDLINCEKVGKWSEISTSEKLRDISELDRTFAIKMSSRTYTMVAETEAECMEFVTVCSNVKSGDIAPDPYQGYGTPTHQTNTPPAPAPQQPPPYQSQPTASMPVPQNPNPPPVSQPAPQYQRPPPPQGYCNQGPPPPQYMPHPAYQQPPPPRPAYQQPPPLRPAYQQPPPPRPAYQQPPPPRPYYQQPPPPRPAYQQPPPRPIYQQPPPPRPFYQQPPPRPVYSGPPQPVVRSNTNVVSVPGVKVVQSQTVTTGRPMSCNVTVIKL